MIDQIRSPPPMQWVTDLRMIGYKEKPRGFVSSSAQTHRSHEFVYIDRGCVRATLAGRAMTVTAGQCLIISAETEHAFEETTGKPYDLINIVYTGQLPKPLANRAIHLCPTERRTLQTLWREQLDQHLYADAMVQLKFSVFLIELARRNAEPPAATDARSEADNRWNYRRKIAHQAIEYLEHHLDKPLNSRTLARHVGLSPSRLRTIIREELGKTLSQILRSVRIEEARRLLHESPENVEQVALQVGYRSAPHFSNVFKREMNMTPSEYARALWMGETRDGRSFISPRW